VEVSNNFAGFEYLNTGVKINGAWEIYRENIRILAKESVSYNERKELKPWIDVVCSELLDQWVTS
jgi:hypothetical protein